MYLHTGTRTWISGRSAGAGHGGTGWYLKAGWYLKGCPAVPDSGFRSGLGGVAAGIGFGWRCRVRGVERRWQGVFWSCGSVVVGAAEEMYMLSGSFSL